MMEEGQVSEPGDPSTRSAARQWRRRGAAALLLMIVAAIIAGVLVTRQKQITSSTKIDASQALPKHQKKDESLITTKSSIETSASFQSDSSEITPLPPVTSDSKTGPTSLTFQNAVAESNANSKVKTSKYKNELFYSLHTFTTQLNCASFPIYRGRICRRI